MSALNEQQFLYHGTAHAIKGDRIVPAVEHGGNSYWGNANASRGEAANQHAWAVPDEDRAWRFALDRADHSHSLGESVAPRAHVQKVFPNPQQTPGQDRSIPGEIKAPHFQIADQHDIRPGHQGTFPGINWNEHVVGGSVNLPGIEDANHPSNLSVQFGHSEGSRVYDDAPDGHDYLIKRLQTQAIEEDVTRQADRAKTVAPRFKNRELTEDTPFPPVPKGAR